MVMPDEILFTLTCSADIEKILPNGSTTISTETYTVNTTPKNWDTLEDALSREDLAINQEITSELNFYGQAAENITWALNNGGKISLIVKRRDNTWQYSDSRTFKGDLTTYSKDGDLVTLSFAVSTVKDEIDKNKSTTYDFELPADLKLSYSGITRIMSNKLSTQIGTIACSKLSVSNWIAAGVLSEANATDSWLFDETKGFYVKALENNNLTLSMYIGIMHFIVGVGSTYGNLMLIHARPKGSGFQVISELYNKPDTYQGITLGFTFIDHNNYQFIYDKTAKTWTKKTTYIKYDLTHPSGYIVTDTEIIATNIEVLEGDFITLIFNTAENQGHVDCYKEKSYGITSLGFDSSDISNFSNYNISVVTIEWALIQLLSKMCSIPPTLVYNLPKYNNSSIPIPVLSSGTGLYRDDSPVISLSFDDIMKHLKYQYGADYNLSGNILTIDYPNTFFTETKAIDITPIASPQSELDDSFIYNKIKVGFETDDDVPCGTREMLCLNEFKVDSDISDDNELDLTNPYKGSPYTIEKYLDDKSDSSSTTKTSDTDIFVFIVYPFYGSTTTTLYKNQTGIDATYFNVALSPMRALIANARFIGISLWNKTKQLAFLTTDKKADYTTKLGYESVSITENNGADATLVSALSNRLFKPLRYTFDTALDLWSSATIEDYLYKYFSFYDENDGQTHNIYINDISLPLTKKGKQSWNTVEK